MDRIEVRRRPCFYWSKASCLSSVLLIAMARWAWVSQDVSADEFLLAGVSSCTCMILDRSFTLRWYAGGPAPIYPMKEDFESIMYAEWSQYALRPTNWTMVLMKNHLGWRNLKWYSWCSKGGCGCRWWCAVGHLHIILFLLKILFFYRRVQHRESNRAQQTIWLIKI